MLISQSFHKLKKKEKQEKKEQQQKIKRKSAQGEKLHGKVRQESMAWAEP